MPLNNPQVTPKVPVSGSLLASLKQVVRELEEATFVIDSQTEELTILEAHLKFLRDTWEIFLNFIVLQFLRNS